MWQARKLRPHPMIGTVAVAMLLGTTMIAPQAQAVSPSGRGASAGQGAQSQATADAGQGAVAEAPGGVIDRILIRINGDSILYSAFEAQWEEQLAVFAGQLPQDQLDAQAPILRMQIMVAMVEERLIEQRANDLGLTADPNEIDRALMRVREENGLVSDEAWSQALVQNGLTEASMRESIGRSIVQQRMMFQEIQRQVVVSAGMLSDYYDEHIDEFSEPEQVLYQQLIWAYGGPDREPLREKAAAALAELRAGVSLSAVGSKYEADFVTSADGASWISPQDLQPEVLEVVQGLTPLTYSEVIEGNLGFIILQLMDRKEALTRPLEEVAPEVRAILQDQLMGEKLQEYTKELRDHAFIDILADEFADLLNAWDQRPAVGAPGPGR